ncbi:MAG TPA: DUF2267 domain-containing protein [Candidatus Baltobacteraceae bacterium]
MTTQAHLGFFDTAVQESYSWIRDILRETGWEDRHYALQALRGVLHAVRDQLTADQSAHLSAQLPVLVRGLYFEGWNPAKAPVVDRDAQVFLDRIRPEFMGYSDALDFGWLARAVLRVLKARVPGEYDKIRAAIPKEVRRIWP